MGVCQFPPSVGFTHPTSSRVLPPRPTNTLTLILSPLQMHPNSVCFFPPLNSQSSSLVNTYLFHTIIVTEKNAKRKKRKRQKKRGENQLCHPPSSCPLSRAQTAHKLQKPSWFLRLEPGMGKEPIKLTKLEAVRGRSTPGHPPRAPPSSPSPHLVGPLQPGLPGKPLPGSPLPPLTPTLETAVTFSQRL